MTYYTCFCTVVSTSTANENNSHLWLKNNIEPWTVVQREWDLSYEFRCNILKKDITIDDIYTEWPILKCQQGYTLVGILKTLVIL